MQRLDGTGQTPSGSSAENSNKARLAQLAKVTTLLTNKVILVTGAGSGIGRATAMIVAKAGAKVFATGRTAASVAETADLIRAEGGIVETMQADVTIEAEVKAMVDAAVATFGRLDGAFNNAGMHLQFQAVQDLTEEVWDRATNVFLKSVFLCMKHEIIAMRKTGGGAIVNNSSTQGVVGSAYGIEYTATKHGVLGATRSAACEAGFTGVRVNAVVPGMIATPMVAGFLESEDAAEHRAAVLARHPIGRFGEPEEVGYAVKWLLSDEAAFVNGAAIAVDGGYTAC